MFGNTVTGNIAYEHNISSDSVFPDFPFINGISKNTVFGNVTVKRNQTIDPIQIDENVIDGNIAFEDNMSSKEPPQFFNAISNNTVSGNVMVLLSWM